METAPAPSSATWVINCFVVAKQHRRQGVGSSALRVALDEVADSGGGVVEARPAVSWSHGRGRSTGVTFVGDLGPIAPAWGYVSGVGCTGTLSMFEREGFTPIAVCGTKPTTPRLRTLGALGDRVLVRKAL